ncbi:MAG: hypothetical protein PHX61_02520 [Alphaproteobacteria bacterium]|nr:hypothetical protein [Alphaproteobacteria bacterium]
MKCEVSNYILNGMYDIESHIGIVGCTSHPLALEVLAEPVIEELEKQIEDAKKNVNWERVEGYGEAIKLLKEGVKK